MASRSAKVDGRLRCEGFADYGDDVAEVLAGG